MRSLPPPGMLILGIVAVGALIVGSAAYEVTSSRDDLMHVLEERSLSIAEAIDISAANAVISNAEVEDLLVQRLYATGRSVYLLDSLGLLNASFLRSIAGRDNVDRINLFDRTGRRVLSSHVPEPGHTPPAGPMFADPLLRPLLRGSVDSLVVGLKPARQREGMRFALGIRRAQSRGAIVLSLDAATLLDFRRRIGFGSLIQNIGDNQGIAYIAFQDDEGIFAASRDVTSLSSFDSDTSLPSILTSRTTQTRVIEGDSTRTFEVLKPFEVDGTSMGVLRVGVAMDEFEALDDRMVRRAWMVSVIVLLLSGLSIGVVLSAQRYRLVTSAYDRIQTYLGTVVSAMPDALITADASGIVTVANKRAEELLSFAGGPLVGRALGGIAGGILAPLQESLTDRRTLRESEFGIQIPNGATVVLSASTSFTFAADGRVETFTALLRDVTRTRAMERSLAQRERTMIAGELASTVAHEIRNPLNAIAMIAQRFDRTFTPRARVKEFREIVGTLKKETRRVNAIVEEFLRTTRPRRSPMRSADPAEMVRAVARLSESQAAMKGVSIGVDVPNGLQVDADADRLEQALLNLVRNAVEAAPDRGRVTLRAGTQDGRVFIAVSDNGPGIPGDLREKVFRPYFTTKAGGTGLGLSIVQQTVEEHGGTIRIESGAHGGVSLIIELPMKTL
ncbi:MAG: ATP-binding protein [Bacteroidetes bacterium]|nr:ATP-binding protein [Bacteroidota bacterium]